MSAGPQSITLNGEPWGVSAPLSVRDLVGVLGLEEDAVAVEKNRQIVRRQAWPSTWLRAGDAVEIVRFVGGG